MPEPGLEILLILGLASATVSTTVASSKIFEGFRAWVETHTPKFLSELFSCSYCLGHWVSGFLVLTFTLQWGFPIMAMIVWWLAVTAISALASGTIGRLYGD